MHSSSGMMADPSPSDCNYCYSLECAVRIASFSSGRNTQAVTCKNARVTLGRNALRQLLVEVNMQGSRTGGGPAVMSYQLADCKVHASAVATGKGAIEMPARQMSLQLSNAAPRQLNVFLKSLQAKLELLRAEQQQGGRGGSMNTPQVGARTLLLQGLPKVFTELSPLTVGEIRKVRKLRGAPESPLAGKPQPSGCGRSPLTARNKQATTPARRTGGGGGLKRKEELMGGGAGGGEKASSCAPLRLPLTDEQRTIVRAAVSGKRNLFFTGSAGTGKSLVLGRIIEMLPAATTFVTAATGVAACQLGGITLHSFAGIGVGNATKENCVKIVEGKKLLVKQWKTCTHLVIDEISMVDADYFGKVEYVARQIRQDDRPFGGIQLIITGDFLQLPPVTKGNEKPVFCFESPAWHRCIHSTFLLKTVKRQNDMEFVDILQQIRYGRCTEESRQRLAGTRQHVVSVDGVLATRLCTHTADADAVNQHQLDNLDADEKVFHAEDSGHIPETASANAGRRVVLKIGAQVMLTRNLDLSRGLSNGSRGCVTGWSGTGMPLVRFVAAGAADKPIEIKAARFPVRVAGSEVPAVRRQLPLQLAWAISIHKSQGLTLDAVEMSLARVFAEGQTYVALSRARSLNALRVLDFTPDAVAANEKVVRYYESLLENGSGEDDDCGFQIRKRSRLACHFE